MYTNHVLLLLLFTFLSLLTMTGAKLERDARSAIRRQTATVENCSLEVACTKTDGSNITVPIHGPPGIKGLTGPPGAHGSQGEPGSKGEAGDPGFKGLQGDPGPPGPKGSSGPKGSQGPPGPEARPGPPGDQGIKGEPGPSGSKGKVGQPGFRGESGEPGIKGEPGESGNPGQAGRPGNPGHPGKGGAPGIKGRPGLPCPSSQPVHNVAFYAWRNNRNTDNSTDIFNVIETNIGDAFNESTFKFTAPFAGVYHFTVSLTTTLTTSQKIGDLIVQGNDNVSIVTDKKLGVASGAYIFTLQSEAEVYFQLAPNTAGLESIYFTGCGLFMV